MAGFIIALIVLSPLWIALLYGFSLGVRAFRISCGHRGEYTSTLRFLAINLCEPLVNTVLVTLLATRSGASPIALWLCTVPMAVLLIPARGLAFSDPFYRDQSRQILRRGLWRWGLNLLVFAGALGGGLLIGTGALGLLIGTIMLWFHVVAGRDQLDHDLATPQSPVPVYIPVAQATAIASRPAAPALAPLFAPPLPLDPATALHCTLCHALAAPATAECPTCGLVFRSRVPAALRSLERYEVLRPLGDGGMSTVYLARGHADGKLCVL
jgi:hypothetical protein